MKKKYKDKHVLNDVSFEVKKGEIFGLVSQSGGGKSTLFKILIGMSNANAGQIIFEDKNVLKRPSYLQKNTGFATQKNMLFGILTLKENALYFGKLYGMKRSQILHRLAEITPLMNLNKFENLQLKDFSGGMIKRANLLISLIHSPKLLILDEPTVGLDSIIRETIWEYIHNINENGTTILITSHLLDEIEEHCDSVGILKKGNIVAIGTMDQYKETYKGLSFKDIFEAIIKNENI
ncbi:ABC transporter ATP-binding protein [Candidatus Pacearchaeota archaeon]|nr:ABC transporter ATP-binding protein [Candidatus Pacearchaeota archaeon]